MVAHILHASTLGALKAVALGTDYNGVHAPKGLDDVSLLPALTEALRQQGFSDAEIRLVLGDNAARLLEESERVQGTVHFTPSDILRPIGVDCDSVIGAFEGVAPKACNRALLDEGPRMPPQSKQKFRIKEVARTPQELELFGDPGTRWQVEGQNLVGKSLFTRILQLDRSGKGRLPLPANRNLTRIFCSPTRTAALREVVIWGQ